MDNIRGFLEEKAGKYNHPDFIVDDPIQVPHLFTRPENIEISGFLTATIAWGQRKTIIRNAMHLMNMMDNDPYDFIMNAWSVSGTSFWDMPMQEEQQSIFRIFHVSQQPNV